ncbi:sensor histidine kinase [Deinococcus ficus]|uniref:sensor histidine kinase n=1 Tax=Deinococcus ficus TaxID=317577 RepID=UPI00174A981C|nr:sensor histidine kinase [Deinococcus ficus]GHF75529.1 histidine kinase [Deinococcus ficus]
MRAEFGGQDGVGAARPERGGVMADLLDARTYRAALYVLLAFPVGVVCFGVLLCGVLLGVVTLPLVVGAGFLLASLWLVRGLADLQRWMAALVGVRFEPRLPRAYSGVLPWLRAVLADGETYRALLFHVIQLPLSLACWVALLNLLALAAAGLGAPLWVNAPGMAFVWQEYTVQLHEWSVLGMMLLGLGSLLLTGGLLNLLGRVWARLVVALLAPDLGAEAAQREVVALRRAAGRVALGDDLPGTLADLTAQALAASTAHGIALVGGDGGALAQAGLLDPALTGPVERPPVSGEADVRLAASGRTLVTLPVTLPPTAAREDGGTLRAVYAAGTRPAEQELAFLLSIADHAGTALHASQLIQRAGERAGEQERARLARELHDSVAQALYGITLGAKTARATLDRDPAKARASLEYTISLAEGGVSEMKALLFSLRPDALEEGGLIAALSQHAHAMEARHGLKVHADMPAEPHLTPDGQAAAYRVTQEALHNVVKHARATQVWLGVRQEAGRVTVTVRDDGRGFDPHAQGRGTLGQRSMRERAEGAGGTLDVQSAPGEGTIVTLRVPTAPGGVPDRAAEPVAGHRESA